MRNGDNPSAVRVLPSDKSHRVESPGGGDDGNRGRRGWVAPALTAATAVLAFVVVTRPGTDPAASPVTTTEPPRLSTISTELVDISTSANGPNATTAWEAVDFPPTATIQELFRFNSSVVAMGSTNEGARVWMSGTGTGWQEVSRFETPDTAESSVDHAALWDGDIVALGDVDDGIGLWIADRVSRWSYHGLIPAMEVGSLVGVAATDDRLLAITSTTLGHEVWTSSNGELWESFGGIEMLDDLLVLNVESHDGWFYAAGPENCQQPPCGAAIYRSRAGLTWAPTLEIDAAATSGEWGAIVDIASTPEALLAVGHTDGGMAVWRSENGSKWRQVATHDIALRGGSIGIQLHNISLGTEAVATISVDDQRHEVAMGSELLTDVGLVTVFAVEEDQVGLEWADGSRTYLETGTISVVNLEGFPQRIAAQGPRIVISGSIGIQAAATPAVWASDDGGESWQVKITEGWQEGRLTGAAVVGPHITVTGGDADQSPLIWHSTWDTSAQEEAGMELVETYFSAAQNGNAVAMLELLPADYSGFEIPSLGGLDMEWWGQEREALDGAAVVATLDYLSSLNTRIGLGDCTSRMFLGDADSVRIWCDFTVESDLLATYSNEEYRGTAEGVVEDGVLQEVHLSTAPSGSMWQMLVASSVGASPEDRATLVRPTDGVDNFRPTFSTDTAATHVRLATRLVAGLLRPGDTRVIETSLGTMEWTWMDQLPIPVYAIPWIAPFESGFVAIGEGNAEEWTEETSLWITDDGVDWEQIPGPERVSSMWNLQPFRDGLIGQAWHQESRFLVYFDGSTWTTIDLPEPPNGRFNDVSQIAVSGDRLMVLTQYWSGSGNELLDMQAWMLGIDGALERVALLPELSPEEETLGLVGYDEGFLLASARFGSARQMVVWSSTDGQTWTELGGATTLEDATYVWNLQHHRDKFFVVGEGAVTTCSTSDDGGGACESLVGMWSSPDGTNWARVFTSSGESVSSYEIGSGTLGLVAVGMESWGQEQIPRPIYLSADGEEWQRAGNLNLFRPDNDWWWVQRPAVGEDTVLLPGSAFDQSSEFDSDTPFLIVGRLIDR